MLCRLAILLMLCPALYAEEAIDVVLDANEPEAVLSILEKRKNSEPIVEDDWEKLFSTEGYLRLKKREESMKRSFTDEDFRRFVLSDELLTKTAAFRRTLENWKGTNVNQLSRQVLTYLPQNARIKARIFPVIKPKTNSFVFEASTNPAIFLYLDPSQSKEKFENTFAHELHHIGYSNACHSQEELVQQNTAKVRQWISAFGEGIAMLAAAGGPDVHPHAASDPAERERWDGDMTNFNSDLKKVEKFFNDILENKLSEEEIQKIAFSFFGIQGPWYTVGWKMASTIEKTFGRSVLIDSLCDPVLFLSKYNQAVETSKLPLASWSPALLKNLQ